MAPASREPYICYRHLQCRCPPRPDLGKRQVCVRAIGVVPRPDYQNAPTGQQARQTSRFTERSDPREGIKKLKKRGGRLARSIYMMSFLRARTGTVRTDTKGIKEISASPERPWTALPPFRTELAKAPSLRAGVFGPCFARLTYVKSRPFPWRASQLWSSCRAPRLASGKGRAGRTLNLAALFCSTRAVLCARIRVNECCRQFVPCP